MNVTSMTEFRKIANQKGANAILALMPLQVTKDGQTVFVVDAPDSVITLGDLHPRVRNMLRAREKRARMGMPPTEMIRADDVAGGADTLETA